MTRAAMLLIPALIAAAAVMPPAFGAAAAVSVPVDPAADTDFLFRLGMLEGHLMVGHDLLKAGRPDLGLVHFGHPVREIYDDIADYLAQHGIAGLDGRLIKLEAAVAAAPASPETEALYQSTIDQVHAARATTPAALRGSVPTMIKVCADTIDAASGEYSEALQQGKIAAIVEYHDSRGYLGYVAQEVDHLAQDHPAPADQSLLARFKAVLAKAEAIVAPLLPAPEPRGTVVEYRAIAAEALAVAKQP